jgi:hypothetical protein
MGPMDHGSGAIHGFTMNRQLMRRSGLSKLDHAITLGCGSSPLRFQEGEGIEGDLTGVTENGGAAELG